MKGLKPPHRAGLWGYGLMALLLLNALSVWLPLLTATVSAFKSTQEIMLAPFALPQAYGWGNFRIAWADAHLGRSLFNSFVVLAGAMALILAGSALAGYALGRMRFRGAGLALGLVLAGMVLPAKLLLLPLFLLLRDLQLLDSLLGLALVQAATALPAGIFILSNFFRALPRELEEAARLDGAGPFATFWKVMLPQVRAPLVLVAIYSAVPIWNDFLLPTVFISSPELKPLPQALGVFFGEYAVNLGALFAGLLLAALPLVLLYLLLSEQFIRGMTAGAVHG